MKKKQFLTEAKRKEIIADKERVIIESFAKMFNRIKRIDENEIKEYDNYNYPAGADADSNAPWHQNDRESEYEYKNGEFEDAEPIDKNYNGPIENEKMVLYSTDGGECIVTMGEIFKTLNVPQETIEVLRANNITNQEFLAAREIQTQTGSYPEGYSEKVERYNDVYFPIMEKYGNEHAEYQYEIEQDDDYGPDGDDYDDRDDRDDDREWGGVDGW
jgi:hypothetical protein